MTHSTDHVEEKMIPDCLQRTEEANLGTGIPIRKEAYVTTSELAKLCGVSRFTIINWVKSGRIKAVQTMGKHNRIPLSEAVSLLEKLHIQNEEAVHNEISAHCWERFDQAAQGKNCVNCLIYKREIDYCFMIVKHFGKGSVSCEGDCLKCSYFNDFFEKRERPAGEDEALVTDDFVSSQKRDLMGRVSYTMGQRFKKLEKGFSGMAEKFQRGKG